MTGSRSIAVVLGVLIVLAGCSGFAGNAPTSSTHGDTTTTGLDQTTEPIYETPLNATEVAVAHTVGLRRAGSFTYTSVVTIGGANGTGRYRLSRSATVAMDTGRILVNRTTAGVRTETAFVEGNGTTYVRTETPDGQLTFNRTNGSIETARYAIDGVPDFLRTFEFEYDGASTRQNQRVYQYSADGVDSLARSGQIAGRSTENLSSIHAYAGITEDGIVRRMGYDLVFESSQGRHTIEAETMYSRIGTAAVKRPNWTSYGDAAANGTLTETRTITNETLGATLTVTAKRPYFDDITLRSGPGAFYDGNGSYEAAAVSPAVTVLIPPSAENASVTIRYDESAVPDGNESAVGLFRYVAAENTWKRIDATLDTGTDSLRVNVTRSVSVVALHEPTWNETQSGAG